MHVLISGAGIAGPTLAFWLAKADIDVLRGDLSQILYDATKDNPKIAYLFNTTIVEVLENSDKRVKVQLSNGDVKDFDVLCAADGQWSTVRKMCFPSSAVTVVDKGLYCAYWTAPRAPQDNHYWNIYIALGSRGINIRPDPYGTMRVCMTRMPLDGSHKREWERASRSDRATKVNFFKKEFRDAGWEAERCLASLEDAEDFYFQAIKQIKMKFWSEGRVVCLGDTAYAPTPLTGMGTSLAVTGAYILAGELSNTTSNGEHPSMAFKRCEDIFRPFVEKIQNIPFFIPAIVHPATAWKRWILQSIISAGVKLANIAWFSSLFAGKEDKEDFVLPLYPKFV